MAAKEGEVVLLWLLGLRIHICGRSARLINEPIKLALTGLVLIEEESWLRDDLLGELADLP